MKAAHTLSFRDVSTETKKELTDLFEMGHNASSARHAHEQRLLYEVDENKQAMLADRAHNPNPQDVCRLYSKWRQGNYGDDNGRGLFEKLQEAVDNYNCQNENAGGGKALLQWYESIKQEQASAEFSSDEDDEMKPMTKKGKNETSKSPMILVLCTPIMRRAHLYVQQSRDIVFLDATSSFDRHNTSFFLLSTVMPAGAVPLGVIVTSDEQEETITEGIRSLTAILPEKAFFGEGPQIGPSNVMIDDSTTERNSLTSVWRSATPLLCTFHFLQRRWTWLHDSKNGVNVKEHRINLIHKVKELVYAEGEDKLEQLYSQLQTHHAAKRYPLFLAHLKSLWPRRREWAHCYRKRLLIRGNHTNNYSEAGMKILKELIFSRVKAYNIVQVFHFLSETLESYYCRKLLCVSNNRLDTYVALRFQGLNASKIPKESIAETDKNMYTVKSKTERGLVYVVDMSVGVCTCKRGIDGSPCSHQAAIAIHYNIASINCIPTLAANVRQIYAQIALGEKAEKNLAFYANVHDAELSTSSPKETDMFFDTLAMDLIRAGARSDDIADKSSTDGVSPIDKQKIKETCLAIDKLAEDLKGKLEEANGQLLFGVEKFVSRYHKLKGSIPLLTSSFHRFGWTFGGSVSSRKGGHLRHGRRISVQATAAGRRKGTKSRGKAMVTPGKRLKGATPTQPVEDSSRYHVPTRRPLKGKRPHSLGYNINKGQQNAGKW